MKSIYLFFTLVTFTFTLSNAQCVKGDCNNGYGTYKLSNGEIEGGFRAGKLSGKGNARTIEGNYVGYFQNNLFDGKGVFQYKNGDKYEGYWKSGLKNGQGQYIYANGKRYKGSFLNDKKHGYGVLYSSAGNEIARGEWINDELPNSKVSFSEMVEELEKSIVFIYNADGGGIKSLGTGFVIGDRYIATNEHVVSDDYYILRMHDNILYTKVEKVYTDINIDLAILKIHDDIPFDYKAIEFANQMPEKGDDVFAIGNPKGYDFTVSKGIISSFRADASNQKIIQTTAAASSGSSGSPLFDSKGKVIGIVTLKEQAGESLNFAYDLLVRRSFLEKFK